MPPPSFLDWMRGGRLAPFLRQATVLDGLGSLIECHLPAGDMSDPPTGDLVFTTTLTTVPLRADLGDGRFEQVAPRGSMFIVPPDYATQIHIAAPHAIRVLAIPAARLAPLMAEHRPGSAPLHFGRLHRRELDSPLVKDLVGRIWQQNFMPEMANRLWMEAAIMMVTAELARLAGEALRPVRGGLAPHVLRRVRERMEADIAEELGTEALAAVAGLSPFHFVRAFRQSTGLPPHAYRQRLRMDQACQLLRMTDLPITEIAFRVGFGSSQAFARAFRATLGAAPGDWRREWRA